jgi:hypothetical protein
VAYKKGETYLPNIKEWFPFGNVWPHLLFKGCGKRYSNVTQFDAYGIYIHIYIYIYHSYSL